MIFTVVTPCLNSENLIEETIESVLGQSLLKKTGNSLEYFICDGGSTDSTLEKIAKYDKFCKVISGPDKGMYDGLAKGLSVAKGGIVSYINAGDFYQRSAFEAVNEVFTTKKVEWLIGFNTCCDENSVIDTVTLPYKFRNGFIQKGVYGTYLPNIQQESVFWSGNLNDKIDWSKLATFKLAGDYYLWREFSKYSNLFIVTAILGSFKRHQNQLSTNIYGYRQEMKKIIEKKVNVIDAMVAKFDFIIWHLTSVAIKKRLNKKQIIVY